jgi:hypothetical protein
VHRGLWILLSHLQNEGSGTRSYFAHIPFEFISELSVT